MRLHGDMGVEVVKSAIGLLATIPSTLVHSLNFLVSSSRSLVLLCARNGDKRVDLKRYWVSLSDRENRLTVRRD